MDLVMNIAKGKVAYYASLPGASDALVAVPLEAAAIVTDATMARYDTLDAILTGNTNEQTTMGRKTLAAVTVNVNDTDNRVEVDADDITWTAASGNAVAALVICYVPDTGTSLDSDMVPLVKLDFAQTPAGSNITLVFPTNGFYWAS